MDVELAKAVENLPEDLPAAKLSDNARIVLAKRYLKKDDNGKPVETPEQMFWRVARVIAEEDRKYGASDIYIDHLARDFYNAMSQGLFEPNSPTLMNAGRPLGQLSACFVLPVEDAISNGKDGIYDTLKSMALVHKSGGGTGFSFSRLRPNNAIVRSTTGVASGPVSFMKLYDASTEVVKQGGTRRGANMGILRVDHPDIRDFITCKSDVSQITNFNISVAVTDAFMEAVVSHAQYDLISPQTGEVVGQEDALDIFNSIIKGAWATGEPGVFFIDRANKFNPVPHLGAYEATNPCGEQDLLPYDVCNLGSVNIGAFVKDGEVDWDAYQETIWLGVHFLDNVIDANVYPLPEIEDLAKRIRRIGLGPMGFADALVKMGIPYNSEEGLAFGARIQEMMDGEARDASEYLATIRGVFPEWERSIWGHEATCARSKDGHRIRREQKLRNCNITTVAPTGTISIIAGCSGGIEPLFAVAFMRNQAGSKMPDVNEEFVRLAKSGKWYTPELMVKIAEEGHIHLDGVPKHIQNTFATAHDITPDWHIRMQAVFQRFVDSSISKTCNFPNSATEDDVREIYIKAYELGCKGVTVYRDGCRPEQVLSTGKTTAPVSRPKVTRERDSIGPMRKTEFLDANGNTRKVYCYAGKNEADKVVEVFLIDEFGGSDIHCYAAAVGRLVSLLLKNGVAPEKIAKKLIGLRGDSQSFDGGIYSSVPDLVAKRLLEASATPSTGQYTLFVGSTNPCPSCKAELVKTEGCLKCISCGWSKC